MKDRDTYRGQFAAYFAGKLSADEAVALEQALAHDSKLAREAEAVRPVVAAMSAASAEDSTEFRLSADRLALIRAAASKQIVEFPKIASPSRRDVSLWRKIGPGLAAAIAVVIGAISGFSSGRGSFEGNAPAFQMAAETSMMADTASTSDDAVHYYPPAYGLDHYELWSEAPAWRATGIGFASSAPLHYGLPGPRPMFLTRENTPFPR